MYIHIMHFFSHSLNYIVIASLISSSLTVIESLSHHSPLSIHLYLETLGTLTGNLQ